MDYRGTLVSIKLYGENEAWGFLQINTESLPPVEFKVFWLK